MGKAMSMETVQKFFALKSDNNSVYAPENKYGYKINVNHPKIKPLYDEYKKRVRAIILSDKERFEFEGLIMKTIAKGKENAQ